MPRGIVYGRGGGPISRLRFIGLSLAAVLFAVAAPLRADAPTGLQYLTGQLLVAKPGMSDPRFRQTVIFIAHHDEAGAFGLILNRTLGQVPFAALLANMNADADGVKGSVDVHYGGPVETRRGFVLHSAFDAKSALFTVNDRYAITAKPELIRDIALGKGPARSILAIGYAGWGRNQLAQELARKDWVVAPASEEMLFGSDQASKWKRAYENRYLSL